MVAWCTGFVESSGRPNEQNLKHFYYKGEVQMSEAFLLQRLGQAKWLKRSITYRGRPNG